MTADDLAFTGHWEQRGLVKVPVMPTDPYENLFDFGPVLPSREVIDPGHVPSHAGFNAHRRKGEEPCEECKAAERMYHQNYRRNRA